MFDIRATSAPLPSPPPTHSNKRFCVRMAGQKCYVMLGTGMEGKGTSGDWHGGRGSSCKPLKI